MPTVMSVLVSPLMSSTLRAIPKSASRISLFTVVVEIGRA